MAECIIARGGGRSDGGSNIPIISGRGTLLLSVVDEDHNHIPDILVYCNDGGVVNNIHTDDTGKCVLYTQTTTPGIIAYNKSIINNYSILDLHSSKYTTISTPLSQITEYTIQLNYRNSMIFERCSNSINTEANNTCFTGNCKFHHYNYANIFIGGGGGGGTETDGIRFSESGANMYIGCGGGGGGSWIVNDIKINKNQNYKFYVGDGGTAGHIFMHNGIYSYRPGGAGGSTTAFGYTVTGGEGGGIIYGSTRIGGRGGTGQYNGGNGGNYNSDGENSENPNWGGGGGGYTRRFNYTSGGSPSGGDGACWANSGERGNKLANSIYQWIGGGGGGAGGDVKYENGNRTSTTSAGAGGFGIIKIDLY